MLHVQTCPPGSEIIMLNATDADGLNVTYSISSNTTFSIDQNGSVQLTEWLDYRKEDLYDLVM